ncbi:MAG: hypothetical protein A3I26_02885 [Candidatus Yanofskybacteria bacterium RIFCSPLOWO2_02_FULL_43_10]|uniref:Uncharacterized protein n=1 Tax=Candidatus Yanofskybacteria bacterium RIFCSPLOWO2_12_FULL_43_11b TaxID=1802710 RepID=A0A1F8HA68_9BACT|nr:MAG: hypothetical protein A2742_01810 [Candidatus Yanofskybacteria bacterium RIFCSPHIGHO2_01_FULL_43_32]OGN11863.1 MAG: hypothetical protein A3C69_01585 [Candidatus Yanofskybacteria bacterium RIFCSPHIGHO2_02_FULL_43_12]OGN25339.1 MAG: hypothetical protein A2923_01600 [Candidatus Yanofskybacteria bacterium RIFCSPLOWO2_01_FULL_43_46]OGN28623.1 MAG: hypothetical protein A3I26_02885 [Candidatus Yanofskybacteria bacterium RIFCSPLOWO2_02_FULL_43_10]OGN33846.1 MAG: hypothetical protein A3G51_01910 
MTAPAHYAIGAASALLIQNYLPAESGDKTRIAWALGIAVASHVAADAIPHAEHFLKGWHLFLELIVETTAMLAVLVGASRSPFAAAIILSGMAGAAIPDGLGMLSHCVNWPALSWVDDKTHLFHGKLNLFYATFFVQVVITILCSIYVRIKTA